MYKLVVFVPVANADELKEALFSAGGGRFQNYDRCCWQVEGQGQFRALNGAEPHIGKVGQPEFVPEMRIEMIVENRVIADVLEKLLKAHPYEEPAYEYWEINPPLAF